MVSLTMRLEKVHLLRRYDMQLAVKKITKWVWFFLAPAFLVSALLHLNPLIKYLQEDSDKVSLIMSGPRTDLGDNYYYFTLLKHAPERMLNDNFISIDPDRGDHRALNAVSNSYAFSLYLAHIAYRIADALSPTSRESALITSIILTSFLSLSFLSFLMALDQPKKILAGFSSGLSLTLIGLVFIDAFGNSLYVARPYWSNSLLSYYSNSLRMVNPTIFWGGGLFAVALIVRWFRKKNKVDYVGAVFLVGLVGLCSISVAAPLFLALVSTLAFNTLKNRSFSWPLFFIALSCLFGLAWSYLQLYSYALTPLGQELRHGEFLGIVVKWQFLMLLTLIPFAWRALEAERVFICALLISSILVGIFCDSFNLGSRLWLRGSVIYVWPISVFIGAYLFINLANIPSRHIGLLKASMIILIVLFVYQGVKPDLRMWQGFIEKDKWEMLAWVDRHLPKDSIVASADLEDAFLLPIYTKSKPVYSMYGLTQRSREENLRRFFYTMSLFGRDKQVLGDSLRVDKESQQEYLRHVMGNIQAPYKGNIADAVIFLELVVYHAYVNDTANALNDPLRREALENILKKSASDARLNNYKFDFIIVENSNVPTRFLGLKVLFDNGRYSLIENH